MLDIFQGTLVVSLLAAAVRIATPLLFSAMGELIAQRAGVWNLSVEGMMLLGAVIGYIAAASSGSAWIGILAAIVACAIVSQLMTLLAVLLKTDQFMAGITLNILAGGLTLFWFQTFVVRGAPPEFPGFEPVALPLLSDIPILGKILFEQRALSYVALLLPVAAWYFLFRTRTGLEFRCAGEYPKALDTKGLNVARRQAIAIMIGSSMSGLGGAFLMLGYSEKFLPELVAGRGWLVIVAIIAGNWMPFRTVGAILIFSLLEAVAIHAQVLNIQIPSQVFLALPYLASLILLAVFRSVSHQPAWLGKPYHRE